jgi:hypothetical protein
MGRYRKAELAAGWKRWEEEKNTGARRDVVLALRG